jgi:ParB family chromosome partitioning protein
VKRSRNVKNISLTSFDDIFKTDEERNEGTRKIIKEISVAELCHFINHPFKLYEGERFDDMVESIRENGVMIPIIVRPLERGAYEILSGHNRFEAAKVVGFEAIPAIVREGLSDDEALIIVTETNLIQRSFADLTHSERAAAISVRHEAAKSQGRRTDLINEVENLLKNSENIGSDAENSTYAHIGRRLETREKIGQEYNLSKNSVARYLRIYCLIEPLKKLIDDNKVPFLAGVELSYISQQEQNDLFDILRQDENLKLDIKKAELLRAHSKEKKLTSKLIEDILSGATLKTRLPSGQERASLPVQLFRIKGKLLSKYFKPEDKPEDIEAELIEALEFYRAHKGTKR